MKMTSWGCCILVFNRCEEPVVHANEPGLPLGQTCLAPNLRLARRLRRKKMSERKARWSALQRFLSRLFLRVGCSLFYIAGFQSYQWLISCLFPGDAETIPEVSRNQDVSTGVETDGQLRGRHIVVTRSLAPLVGWGGGVPTWCPWGFPQSRSEQRLVGAGIWWR